MAMTLAQAVDQERLNQQLKAESNPLLGLVSGVQQGINERKGLEKLFQIEQFKANLQKQQDILDFQQQKELQQLKVNAQRKENELARQQQLDLELAKLGVDSQANRSMAGEVDRVASDDGGAFIKRGVVSVDEPAMSLSDGTVGDLSGTVIPKREKRVIPSKSKLQMLAEAARKGQSETVTTTDPVTGEIINQVKVPKGKVFKGELSPVNRLKLKKQAVGELLSTVKDSDRKIEEIEAAKEATKKISGGLFGKIERDTARFLDPNSPLLEEWQKIKMVLTDAQLLNTARTKGAISDKEMALFASAAANDDIASVSAMRPVFERLLRIANEEKDSAIQTFDAVFTGENQEFKDDVFSLIRNKEQPKQEVTREQAIEELRRRGLIK